MTPDEAANTLGATLAALGIAQTALGGIAETIARRPDPAAGPALLPRISLDLAPRDAHGATDSATSDADLVARAELGRGGMGIVHLAEQRSLIRDVAVKTSLASDPSVFHAVVREARIMGSLEHPNVVPVHALGLDARGAPLLVMKRIEGVSWRVLLAHPEHDAWRPLLAGHDDRLRANVEILSHVCRALAFAHDRGVIHRDVKPENVMIGRFGEVYLLDWGVAIRLDERASEPPAIVGTLGYLAPEMARGDPNLVDARTDVYLLGATLYEVLAGKMPHEAPSPMAALLAVLVGEEPAMPKDAPAELTALVRQAMANAPSARVASANRVGPSRLTVTHRSAKDPTHLCVGSFVARCVTGSGLGATLEGRRWLGCPSRSSQPKSNSARRERAVPRSGDRTASRQASVVACRKRHTLPKRRRASCNLLPTPGALRSPS